MQSARSHGLDPQPSVHRKRVTPRINRVLERRAAFMLAWLALALGQKIMVSLKIFQNTTAAFTQTKKHTHTHTHTHTELTIKHVCHKQA